MSVPAIYMSGGRVLMSSGAAVEVPSTGTLQITTGSLAAATVGTAYSQALTVTGGTGAGYSVYIQQAIPNSLRWLQMTGVTTLGGMPQAVETSQVTLVACDNGGNVSAPVTLSLVSSATGSLAFVSSTTAGNSTSNGIFAQQQICSGGVPPYIHASPNQVQPWTISWDGFLLGAPTSTGSLSIIDAVTDSAGTTITQTLTSTIGSGIGLSGYDYNTTQINLPVGTSGQNYIYNFWAYGGSGSGYSCSVTSGSITPGLSISTLAMTGAPTRAGTFIFTVTVTDGTHNQAYTICHQVLAADTATRPGYNTGTGFFVANGKFYDPSGKRFTLRGLDRTHYDSATWASGANGALAGANSVRVFMFDYQTAAYAANQCSTQYLPAAGNYILPILTMFSVGGTVTTGSSSTTLLASAMNDWLGYYSGLSSLDNQIAYNIANEWGPGSASINWLYAYQYQASSITAISSATVTVNSAAGSNPFANSPFALIKGAGGITDVVLNVSSTGGSSGAWTVTFTASPTGTYTSGGTLYGGAVGVMRGTGYLGPLVIDAGGSGQDYAGIVANAQAIQNSDPQQNCVFSYHGYGSATNNECVITSATKANPCVLTLDSSAAYHPFLPQYPSFTSNNFGHNNFFVSGALGMTQLNGAQASSNNNAGGSSGSWTVKLSANSTAWGTYTANSARLVYAQDYRQIIASLAALRTNNVCAMCLEFGPGNGMGSRAISFTGYISGTTLTVVSMLTEGAILPYNIAAFGVGTVLTGNSSAPVSNGTTVLSQSSGATGGAGVYVINNSQTVGSAGSPVPMYIQEAGGSSTSWQGLGIDGSPTDTSLAQIICACEANLVPWNYWASDDHDQGTNQECSWAGGWFGIVNELGGWAVPSDLTSNGMDVVFNPCYGLRTLAQPASSYA